MEVFVGLDVHLKKTHATLMVENGRVIKQGKFATSREELEKFLKDVPLGAKVALECLGFCWPWVDFLEELGYEVKLANPLKVKQRADDIKTDKVDSELLANLLRVNWLPTSYLPSKEFRWLRNILRHRAFRKKIQTALKNRTWSEFWKRGINPELNLGSNKGRETASNFSIYEVNQNLQAIQLLEDQIKQVERFLKKKYFNIKPVNLLQKIKGIGFLIALTIYAEIVDINRFPNPDKLAHYVGLVPKVRQSGDCTKMGKETKGNKWLKWALIEAAWSHIRTCPDGRLARIYRQALKRKKSKSKAIKIVARKLVNIIWAVWKYGKEFDAYKGLR